MTLNDHLLILLLEVGALVGTVLLVMVLITLRDLRRQHREWAATRVQLWEEEGSRLALIEERLVRIEETLKAGG